MNFEIAVNQPLDSALDEAQARRALLREAPAEESVGLKGRDARFPGIAVSEFSNDQQQLVEETVKTLLAPYRSEDVDEAMAVLKSSGGFNSLHMAFYRQGDVRRDGVWDIWRIGGPSFVWHFRGAPHVHAYINIGVSAKDAKS